MENATNPNAKGSDNVPVKNAPVKLPYDDMIFPFYDKRTIIVKRKAFQTLPGQDPNEARQKIGSYNRAGTVGRGLTREEEKRWLSRILSVDPSSSNWEAETADYWHNISKEIPPTSDALPGLVLEAGLMYETREQYAKDKSRKANEWGVIENPAGEPINIEDYIFWRHCLVYPDVANDESLVGMSPKIRFFLFSKEKEIQQKKANTKRIIHATTLYNQNISDRKWIDFMLRNFIPTDRNAKIQIKDLPLIDADEKDTLLYEYLTKDVEKFISLAENKNLQLLSHVELAIALGVLHRIPNTNTISHHGVTLGNTLDEVIAFLNNAKNSDIKRTIDAEVNVMP